MSSCRIETSTSNFQGPSPCTDPRVIHTKAILSMRNPNQTNIITVESTHFTLKNCDVARRNWPLTDEEEARVIGRKPPYVMSAATSPPEQDFMWNRRFPAQPPPPPPLRRYPFRDRLVQSFLCFRASAEWALWRCCCLAGKK